MCDSKENKGRAMVPNILSNVKTLGAPLSRPDPLPQMVAAKCKQEQESFLSPPPHLALALGCILTSHHIFSLVLDQFTLVPAHTESAGIKAKDCLSNQSPCYSHHTYVPAFPFWFHL